MKRILMLVFLFGMCGAMDTPQRTPRKRRAENLQEPVPKAIAVYPEQERSLPDLPLELQTRILSLILNVSGATNNAKLFKAAEHLRNYMRINKAYYEWLNTPIIVNGIIRELAKRYTFQDDFTAVVLALGTDSATKWLAHKVQDSLVNNQQNHLVYANDGAKNFILRLLEHLRASFTSNQVDNFILLTKYIDSQRKAWLLNNLTIQGSPILSYLVSHNMANFLDRVLAIEGIEIDRADATGSTPLMAAVEVKNQRALQKLINAGAALNILNTYQETPLMIAIEEENMPAAQLLVTLPTINLNADEEGMNSPLHKAIDVGDHDMFDLLLKVGLPHRIDINAHGLEGETPLMKAVSNNFIYFIDELIKKGADLNTKNDHGQTALMIAAGFEDMQPLWMLIESHANVNERDNEGHTALWYARGKNRQQNIRILEQAGAQE